jgi:hypothetical protein
MLCVGIKVNKDQIGELKVRNLGIEESYARGLAGTKRWYKYSVVLNGSEVEGEVIHDREEGALMLIKKVIEHLETYGNLKYLNQRRELDIKERLLKMVGDLEK